eukprot:TRINITY_DN49039_c0_g1_i1.p1 TRINITY_DN49039_c0_g1~~TRINITY_DN49039_c0_g1_i1.p1  ORF type:complete len:437 (-),score=56.10 TRINITY_DN49039_c0_g1_i1:148-1428(-)
MAFLTGTWSLISSSAEVISRARRLTLRIQGLLQPNNSLLTNEERRGLLGLQKRVDCLVGPLNFLLTRSQQLDSCVQQVASNTQELLFDVWSFVERFSPDVAGIACDGQLGSGHSAGLVIDSEWLDHYLKELDFACASVNMAVSILQATGTTMVAGQSHMRSANGHHCSVSLTSLLAASQRIQDLCGQNGDLCNCPGILFKQDSEGTGEWIQLPWTSMQLKVLAEERSGVRKYGLVVSGSEEGSSPRSHDAEDAVENKQQLLEFPIELALDAALSDASCFNLPGQTAFLWQSRGSIHEVLGDLFQNFELVPEPRSPSAQSPSGPSAFLQQYAFVFDTTSERRTSSRDCTEDVEPLEVFYLARLCALDDGWGFGSSLPQPVASQSDSAGSVACPPHLLCSDELLSTLLLPGSEIARPANSNGTANGKK